MFATAAAVGPHRADRAAHLANSAFERLVGDDLGRYAAAERTGVTSAGYTRKRNSTAWSSSDVSAGHGL
jgi:hypothetical protein